MKPIRTSALLCLAGLLLVPGPAIPRAAAEDDAELSPEALLKMADEVEEEVEALRGWKFKRPVKTAVYTEPQLRKYIEKKLFEDQLGGGLLEKTQAFLRLVGLIPPDCDMKRTILDVLLEQVGGFYDPDTQTFYLLKRAGVEYGPFVNRILIAHELTHALDDQYVDLDKLMTSYELTEDRGIAIGSVVEGSATVLMQRYTLAAMESGKYDANELMEVAAAEMQRAEALVKAPRYFTSIIANYLCGMFFMMNGDLTLLNREDAGEIMQKRLTQAAKDVPRSSEQILHPNKYWDAALRDEPVTVDEAAVQKLFETETTHLVHKNTVGELFCAQLTSPADDELNIMAAGMPTYWTNQAAEGWGGDRFFLFASGKDGTQAAKELKDLRAVWITAWDTAVDREEFVEFYESYRERSDRTRVPIGKRAVAFLFGFPADEAERLATALGAASIAFTKDGQPWRPDADE